MCRYTKSNRRRRKRCACPAPPFSLASFPRSRQQLAHFSNRSECTSTSDAHRRILRSRQIHCTGGCLGRFSFLAPSYLPTSVDAAERDQIQKPSFEMAYSPLPEVLGPHQPCFLACGDLLQGDLAKWTLAVEDHSRLFQCESTNRKAQRDFTEL